MNDHLVAVYFASPALSPDVAQAHDYFFQTLQQHQHVLIATGPSAEAVNTWLKHYSRTLFYNYDEFIPFNNLVSSPWDIRKFYIIEESAVHLLLTVEDSAQDIDLLKHQTLLSTPTPQRSAS